MGLAALVVSLFVSLPASPAVSLHVDLTPTWAPAPPQTAAEAARVERDVPYATLGSASAPLVLALDAYLPAGAGPHPAVLVLHGGAWMHGHRRDVRPIAERLAAAGYAAFAPSYRFAPAHRYPAQLEDCRRALQFVRAEAARFHVDPARVGAVGFSAGAHLAAMLGVLDEGADPAAEDPVLRQSSRVQCVVSYFGPVLLTRERTPEYDTQPPPELLGDAPDSAYEAASPLRHVTKGDAPFLLVHGDRDDTVPVEHSLVMDEALRAAGVPCELFVIEGGDHGGFVRNDLDGEHWKRTLRFLQERLRPAGALPAGR